MALKKNTHEIKNENLCAYIDGQLNADEAAVMEAHIASCAECAWEKETLERTRRLMAQVPRCVPPRSFVLREAQVAAPSAAGFFTSARLLYLRGATAAAGVLLAAVVAGDAWVRPLMQPPMASLASPTQTEMLTFGATLEAQPTEDAVMKSAAPATGETPEPTAMPAPDDGARGAGGGPEETSAVAGQEYGVNDLGAPGAPIWVDIRLWRVAEGMLGTMFVALLAITAAGWRRIARLG